MWSFFHGWRRKAGVVTLVMALAAMGAWLRSLTFIDEFGFVRESSYQRLVFLNGAIVWAKEQPTPFSGIHDGRLSGPLQKRFRTYPTLNGWQSCYPYDYEMWQVSWAGFGYGKAQPDGYTLSVWIIPYWSITMTLTLLSSYLLIWKPRKAKSSDQPAISILASN